MSETRVLPADVYDALELAAEAFGGIGYGKYYDYPNNEQVPYCAVGAAFYADPTGDAVLALRRAGIRERTNDNAFAFEEGRIPFSEWCKRLRVVRGEDSPRSTP